MRVSVIAVSLASFIGLGATRADAFCGFYVGGAGAKLFNNATEVVLMRHGTTTVLSMQNNYQGPPEQFALVVPVPVVVREAQVKTLPPDVFGKVDVLGAPRLVEYWEQDPCMVERDYEYDHWPDAPETPSRCLGLLAQLLYDEVALALRQLVESHRRHVMDVGDR